MSNKVLGKTGKLGIVFQPKASGAATAFACAGATSKSWTNPAVAATNFRELNADALVTIPEPDVQIDQVNSMGQLGLIDEIERSVREVNGLHKLNFQMPADVKSLVPLFAAALLQIHDPGVGSNGNYFANSPYSGTIDFANNGAPLHSLAVNFGASADDGYLLTNAIIETLTFKVDFNAKGMARRAIITGTFVGNALTERVTLSGTWVVTTPEYLNTLTTGALFLSAFTVNSVDCKAELLRSFELTINNKVDVAGRTLGVPSQYDVKPEITTKLVLDYNDVTEDFIHSFVDGHVVAYVLENGIADAADGRLKIVAPYGLLTSNPVKYNGDFIGIELNIKQYQSSTNSALQVLMFDGLSWVYNPS